MKKLTTLTCFVIAISVTFCSCKKSPAEQDELSKLPPPTQEGKNTFGCLVNGKAWVSQRDDCSIICDPAFEINIDGSHQGVISIKALKIKGTINERIGIIVDSMNYFSLRHFSTTNPLNFVRYKTNSFDYDHYVDTTVNYWGYIQFSKKDYANRIFAGTFEFTLSKPGWDTIKITNGRFDGRLY